MTLPLSLVLLKSISLRKIFLYFYLNEIDFINLNTINHNQLPPLRD